MTKKIIFVATAIVLLTSCKKDANEVLNSVYSTWKENSYSSVAKYLYLGQDNSPLTKEEQNLFYLSTKGFHSKLSSFSILKCTEDVEKGTASYIVKTTYSDGKSMEEKGLMAKDKSGNWKIVVLNNLPDSLISSTDSTYIENTSKNLGEFYILHEKRLKPLAEYGLYNVLASRGDAASQYALYQYLYNSGLKEDQNKGLDYLKKAAQQGNINAEYSLGWLYYNGGNGIEKNYEEALKLFKKASHKGLVAATTMIGFAYRDGKGVEKDDKQARKYFLIAAEKGDPDAQLEYGFILDKVDYDIDEAMKWYKKSADQGNRVAQCNLGIIYDGTYGPYRYTNYEKAIYYLKKSAEQDYAPALNQLGYLYETGLGGELDINKAYEYYLKSARLGNIYGERNANRLAGR